jgi:RNA polymerase sigma-70 factor (ECF subfamily)
MAITDLEPRRLVDALNDGDDQAFVEIVRAHHQGLLAHALHRLHDVQAAEDAVQETLVRAYRALFRFDGELLLRPWLHRILSNVCHDEAARRQRDGLLIERVCSEVVVVADPADTVVDRIDPSRDVVATALAELPVSYREALVLRDVKELPYEEVAAAIGVTEGNARVRVMRGRAALRRALGGSHAVVVVLP